MVTNNEAVENFLNGKRNLAVYQFSQLIKETTNSSSSTTTTTTTNTSSSPPIATPSSPTPSSIPLLGSYDLSSTPATNNNNNSNVLSTSSSTAPFIGSSSSNINVADNQQTTNAGSASGKQNNDEIAFNYAMINLFTGCPQRASIIFSDLVKRYPRNPRLWLRLAESMLAAERAKMTEFEHIQQLAYPHSRDHLIKPKNKPILIKINPNYCQQQIQQQFQLQRGTPSNFLVTIKGYLQKSLELINEYNDISLLTDDIPNPPMSISEQQQQQPIGLNLNSSIASTSSPSITTSSMMTDTSSNSILETTTTTTANAAVSLGNNSNNNNNITQIPKLSQQLSYANPYQSISRADLYHLRNKVQLNLAYICLCMGEPVKAINYTTQCLKSSPLGYEKVLASLYHAEACILASRVDEAIQFLNLEVLNMAKNLSQEHPSVTGDTSKRVVYGEEMQNQLKSGALTTVVTYNLSVAYAAKGEFSNAHKILMKSIQPTKPNPMQIIICLLYIQLQQGQLDKAKRTILNNLPQFR